MNLNKIFQRSWHMLWHYRALWLFGAFLALAGASLIRPVPWRSQQENDQWILIKFSQYFTLRLPGADMTIDLTTPGGIRITTPDSLTWHEIQRAVQDVKLSTSIDLWRILIEFAVILAIMLLMVMVARYIAETALIRMVDENEASGIKLGMGKGLRRGFSLRAGRLFLLDLIVRILVTVIFIVLFGLALTPVLLAIGSQQAVLITTGVGTVGLLILAFCLWLAARLLVSVVLQPIRRACVLENQSLWSSIWQGVRMTKHHLKEVGLVWLVWMGLRVLLVPLNVMIALVLVPVLLLTIPLGLVLGIVPSALVAGISSLFTSGINALIIGVLAGLPIFLVVMFSPMVFLNGWVEVYLSSIWTLAYRDLRVAHNPIQEPSPQAQALPVSGTAD